MPSSLLQLVVNPAANQVNTFSHSISLEKNIHRGKNQKGSEDGDSGPQPQEIPSKWESDIAFTIELDGQLVMESSGHMWNDDLAKLSRVSLFSPPSLLFSPPSLLLIFSILFTAPPSLFAPPPSLPHPSLPSLSFHALCETETS